jgi:hypothetical protein
MVRNITGDDLEIVQMLVVIHRYGNTGNSFIYTKTLCDYKLTTH